jgi:hypothetical protein
MSSKAEYIEWYLAMLIGLLRGKESLRPAANKVKVRDYGDRITVTVYFSYIAPRKYAA